MISTRRILLIVIWAAVAVLSIIQYYYSVHSSSNPQLPYINFAIAVGATVGLAESIISLPRRDYTKDPDFKRKWRNFIAISTSITLIYVVAGVIAVTILQSITVLLEIGLLYVMIMSALYVKVLRR
ncbi:MAG: hypothetical protein ACP5HQ_01620 [Thermoprotei archaeon]